MTGVQSGKLEVSNEALQNPDSVADKKAKLKCGKYADKCRLSSMTFIPFVVYTTGKFHQSATAFLQDLAEVAADRRHISAKVIYNYYLKVMSVCLVNRIGYIISAKTSGWMSNNTNLVEAYREGNSRALAIGDTEID